MLWKVLYIVGDIYDLRAIRVCIFPSMDVQKARISEILATSFVGQSEIYALLQVGYRQCWETSSPAAAHL